MTAERAARIKDALGLTYRLACGVFEGQLWLVETLVDWERGASSSQRVPPDFRSPLEDGWPPSVLPSRNSHRSHLALCHLSCC